MRIALLADVDAETPSGALARALLEALPRVGEPVAFGPGTGLRDRLRPREFERVIAIVRNDPDLAFVARELRRVGGIVVLQEWVLDRLAGGLWPALTRPGLAGALAAWREGGVAQLRRWRREGAAGLALNRSVVRFGDAFVVADEETRRRVLEERNAPTPTATLALDDPGAAARRIAELLERFPCHRTARKSLIQAAIQEADAARAARETDR